MNFFRVRAFQARGLAAVVGSALVLACGSSGSSGGDAPSGGPGGGGGQDGGPGGDVPPGTVPPLASFVELQGLAVGVGTSLACAITDQKAIVCWGGSLGDPQRAVAGKNAFAIQVGSTPTQLSVGPGHACARFEDGTARCWGENSRGELGGGKSGSSVDPKTAVTVAGISDVDAVSAGYEHSCALSKGKIYCWGYNTSGEVGDGTTIERDSAVEVPGIADATAVAAGSEYSCAVRTAGKVSCWGSNIYSQIGIAPGPKGPNVLAPADVVGLTGVTALEAGATAACAIAAGEVTCWGDRWVPQLSADDVTKPAPLVTIAGIAQPTSISVRKGHPTNGSPGCALAPDGSYCWPMGLTSATVAVRVDAPGATTISVGDGAWCGVFDDRHVKCWGSNTADLLGDGSFTLHPAPVYVPNVSDATALFVGESRNCVVGKDQRVNCWGTSAFVPDADGAVAEVPALAGATDVSPANALQADTCAVVGGAVRCVAEPPVSGPASYDILGITNAVQVGVVPTAHGLGCARLADGGLACWSSANPPTAYVVAGVTGVKRVEVTLQGTCILQDTVRCWNSLPTAAGASQLRPADPTFAGATDFAGRSGYVCATTPAATVCKDGDPREVVGSIPGAEGASRIAVGDSFACAVIGGAVKCWGEGYTGQLGPGSFSQTKFAIPVPNLAVPLRLASAGTHTCALEGDGRVQCWGSNLQAAISPRATSRTAPTQVRLRW